MPPPRARDSSAEPRISVLANRLHSVAIHLLRRVRREDAAAGVSAAQLSALSVVVFAGSLPLGELATAEQVRAPTMSRLVDGLERAGLVAREPDPADGRVVRVRATTAGEQVLQEGRRRRVGVLAHDLYDLAPEDQDTLMRAVVLLEDALRRSREPD